MSIQDYVDQLEVYAVWFLHEHRRYPINIRAIADFIDEERAMGRFPDNKSVNAMYGMIGDPAAEAAVTELRRPGSVFQS